MVKKADKGHRTHKGVEFVACPKCGHEMPIPPDAKYPASYGYCSRCGADIPDMKQYLVEEEKVEEQVAEPVAAAAPAAPKVFTRDGEEEAKQ